VNSQAEILAALAEYDNYLICGHENPDPDSIGSMLAMYQYLTSIGKRAWMMSADPIPNYPWPNIDRILPVQELDFQAVVIVDCEPERTGRLLPLVEKAEVTINIDHHKGNPGSCTYNYIDTSQAATCMILYQLFQTGGVEFDYRFAQPLYAGIIGDTGGFRHANTTKEVFLAAAELTGHGAVPDQTAHVIYGSKPLELMRFLGYALAKLDTRHNRRLVWLALSNQDFVNFEVDPRQCDQLIEYVRMVEGSEIAILFREISPGVVRIGFRSRGIDIHQLAVHFGGGGHLLAAGAQLEGKLPEIVSEVIDTASRLLEGEAL